MGQRGECLGGDGSGCGRRRGRPALYDFGGGVDIFHHKNDLLEGKRHSDLGLVVTLGFGSVDTPDCTKEGVNS